MSLSLPTLLQSLPPRYPGRIPESLGVTLLVSAVAIAGGLAIDLSLTALYASAQSWLYLSVRVLAALLRKTPLLAQLPLRYSGAARLLGEDVVGTIAGQGGIAVGVRRSPAPSSEFLAAALGITLHAGAFFSEELRASIQAVSREAALLLGFTPCVAFLRVMLPQALRVSASSLLGQYTNTIKDTSLAMGIGLAGLVYSVRQVETDTLLALQVFAAVAVLYVGVILLLQWVAPRVLRWLGRTSASTLPDRAPA